MKVSNATRLIADNIIAAGGTPIIVGGAVRDWLMGSTNPSKDIDIEVYGIDLTTLQSVLSPLGEVHAVGSSFGVLKLTLDGEDFDISLPRRESKSGSGHKGFVVEADPNMSFKDAASRRDFTINAIGYDLNTNEILDPWNGQEHIDKGILVHVSDAFDEDPLRVLRFCQFAARFQFSVAHSTLEKSRSLKTELKTLPSERFWEEFKKLLLKSEKPSIGLNMLIWTQAIEVFPELNAMLYVNQDPEWHPEGQDSRYGSLWTHNYMVTDEAARICREQNVDEDESLIIILGAMCHDLGKPSTTEFKDGRWRSHNHEAMGEDPTRSFLTRIGCPPSIIEEVVPLVVNHLAPAHFYRDAKRVRDGAIRRLALKVPLERLVRVATADYLGRTTPEALAREPFEPGIWLLERAKSLGVREEGPAPILMGRHLIQLGVKPGPEMGKILKAAFEVQLDGGFDTEASAIEWAKDTLNKSSVSD